MKRFIFIILTILFVTTYCFASIVEIGGGKVDSSGFSYVPVTKTDSTTTDSTETDTIVWTPSSGSKIVLLGVKFNSANATTLLVETGSTAVIPTTECAASGQIVIGNGTPIWKGTADETLTYTVPINGRHSILMWGYETTN